MRKRKPEKRTKKRTQNPLGKLKYAKFSLKRTGKVNNKAPDILQDILKAVPICYYIPSIKRTLTAPYSFGFQEFSKPPCWCKLYSWFKYWFLCEVEIQTGGSVEKMIVFKRTARRAMEEIHASQMEMRVVGGL
jgi:hypothetical protein